MVWVSPRHAALALATGLVCGIIASRIRGMISPPYAAILGTLIGYPALVAVWRRLRLGRRGR
jgi:xanthosine utilization system XapX-like protein